MANSSPIVAHSLRIRCGFHCIVAVLTAILFVGAIYRKGGLKDRILLENVSPECDFFSGEWVFDEEAYPLYREGKCSFMLDDYACQKFGRKDLRYQNWRWQPHRCDLPRFNATLLLERLRNKRLVFVGDSLNRDQWVSMVCLIDSSTPPSTLTPMQFVGSLITVKAKEYNVSIDFYWAPLLVESNCDDPIHHQISDRIIRVQAIEKHAKHWTDADVLVFNSYIWWLRPKMKVLWGSFNSSDGIYKEIEMLRSYEMTLKTWADWLEVHVNRFKTKLFFVSMSPTHLRGKEWGSARDQNCYNETQPIQKEEYKGRGPNPEMMEIVGTTINNLKERGLKVQLLNITQLSQFRKDGHPSIYRRQWVQLTREQLSSPESYADCAHWCLPGVPDVWNQILYAYILREL